MRIVYLGTPAFAALPLRALAAAGHDIVGVVTQPDRPAGRSQMRQPPPVKVAAQELGLHVVQPATLKNEAVVEQLRALRPEVGVVAAYGEILRNNVLEIPSLGYLNVHPSLLPLYRGPTPVAAAIAAGDEITGVSIIRLVRAMDAGPIVAQATITLDRQARAGALTDELFAIGAQLLAQTLPLYAAGDLQPQPQDDSLATYCKLLSKDDGKIDWTLPALVIERLTRAYDPWPGTWTIWHAQTLKIGAARVDAEWSGPEAPGTLLGGERVRVATGSGALELIEVQPAGKRMMPALDWWRGQRARVGQQFET